MKNIVLSIILLTVFASGLLTNTDKKEKYKDIEKTIKRGRKLTLKQIQQLYYHVVKDNDGDIRELNLLIKFIKNGNEDSKKIAIEILPKSIKDNFDMIKDMDYNYFYHLLQPSNNSKYDVLVLESCIALYKISTLFRKAFNDTLFVKIAYYAWGTNYKNWNLLHTITFRDYNPQSSWLRKFSNEQGLTVEEYSKSKAIGEIRRKAIRSLFLIDDANANKIIYDILENEKEDDYLKETSDIKNMIKVLLERKQNGEILFQEYDFNK